MSLKINYQFKILITKLMYKKKMEKFKNLKNRSMRNFMKRKSKCSLSTVRLIGPIKKIEITMEIQRSVTTNRTKIVSWLVLPNWPLVYKRRGRLLWPEGRNNFMQIDLKKAKICWWSIRSFTITWRKVKLKLEWKYIQIPKQKFLASIKSVLG